MINERQWREFLSDGYEGDVKFMEPMRNHTSLRIGGPADVYAIPQDLLSARNVLTISKEKEIPFMPIGGGTNLLCRDGGIEGIVISLNSFRRIEVVEEKDGEITLFVESGTPLQKLVNLSKEKGYTGIEGLAGIPGSVGGAIAGNAGAFGYEIKSVLISTALMNVEGRIKRIRIEDLGLDYRTSNIPAGSIILSANIRLRKDIPEDVANRIDGFLREKRERQPISERSAGCVFKNPEGTSAGRLIDEAGCKGMRVGDVEVSPMHTNFFINRGEAKASDFIRLMEAVKSKVMEVFGIELEPEIRIVGRE